jgi:hypothetical protein
MRSISASRITSSLIWRALGCPATSAAPGGAEAAAVPVRAFLVGAHHAPVAERAANPAAKNVVTALPARLALAVALGRLAWSTRSRAPAVGRRMRHQKSSASSATWMLHTRPGTVPVGCVGGRRGARQVLPRARR